MVDATQTQLATALVVAFNLAVLIFQAHTAKVQRRQSETIKKLAVSVDGMKDQLVDSTRKEADLKGRADMATELKSEADAKALAMLQGAKEQRDKTAIAAAAAIPKP